MARTANIDRQTGETDIQLELDLDGAGNADVATGVGFLDHMLTLWAAHALVDLKVRAGSITGVVGSNGAGKTTLIRLLVGALRSDSGDISVLGMDPYQHRWEVRARVGYMPQATRIPDHTIRPLCPDILSRYNCCK